MVALFQANISIKYGTFKVLCGQQLNHMESNLSFLAFADGREFLLTQTGEICTKIPRLECFAIKTNLGDNQTLLVSLDQDFRSRPVYYTNFFKENDCQCPFHQHSGRLTNNCQSLDFPNMTVVLPLNRTSLQKEISFFKPKKDRQLLSWAEASDVCISINSHLPTLRDEPQFSRILHIISSKCIEGFEAVFVGLHQHGQVRCCLSCLVFVSDKTQFLSARGNLTAIYCYFNWQM